MKTIVTHSGAFHADDVFAVATLQLAFGVDEVTVIRSRDAAVIATADIVVDVGGVYDVAAQRFDHHQNGAPVRANGIPYAAFGLVWQTYGEQVGESLAVATALEKKIVLAVDADDNGITLTDVRDADIPPFELAQVIRSFVPERGSDANSDEAFFEAVVFVRGLLSRLIVKKTASLAMEAVVAANYAAAVDKRVLVFTESVSAGACIDYPDVMVVVMPDNPAINQNWLASTVRVAQDTFDARVYFPESWRGLRDAELAAVSGIPDAIFCHKAGFMFVAASREGAMMAAERAG